MPTNIKTQYLLFQERFHNRISRIN